MPAESADPSANHYCEGSLITDRSDAYRCFAGSSVRDFCIANPDDLTEYACADASMHWTVLKGMERRTYKVTDPIQHPGLIVFVKLTDGTLCDRANGPGPAAVGDYKSVGPCSDKTEFWTRFDKATATNDDSSPFGEGTDAQGRWIVKSGPDGGPLTARSVEVAYR